MPHFTLDDIPERYRAQVLRQLAPKNETAPVPPRLPDAKLKHHAPHEPLATDQGKSQGEGRALVRIERRATKLLDKDNLYGSVKWVCDALRACGCIRDDDPNSIELIVTQRRVPTRKECGTGIEIDLL